MIPGLPEWIMPDTSIQLTGVLSKGRSCEVFKGILQGLSWAALKADKQVLCALASEDHTEQGQELYDTLPADRKYSVAVKKLTKGSSVPTLYAFLDEATVMTRLSHPNLVQLLGIVTRV